MSEAAQRDRQHDIFRLHQIEGKLPETVAVLQRMLATINRQWQRRRWLSFALSAILLIATTFLFLRGYYLIFWGGLLATFFTFQLGLSHGQLLEVEVETLMLCLALLDALDELLDPDAPLTATVDLRSADHATSQRNKVLSWLPGYTTTRVMRDHWFTLHLPLWDGFALLLRFSEDVRASSSSFSFASRGLERRRLGRHYRVELYRDARCLEASLAEAITSHVGAPSATTLASRVEEGCDTFLAGVRRLRAAYCESQYEVNINRHALGELPAARRRSGALPTHLTQSGLMPFEPSKETPHEALSAIRRPPSVGGDR